MKLGIIARAAAVVLFAGTMSIAAAGTSQAADVTLDITYSCTFTLIGAQDQPSTVTATNMPDSATAGVPTAEGQTQVVSTVSESATSVLNWLGAATVEGTLSTTNTINNAGTVSSATATLTIPKTNVAPSGTFNVTGTGVFPSLTLANPGTTTINLGNASLTLTPRHADGSTTFLGTFTSPCTVKAGQNTKLHEFQVA
ncbi:hypothetical protein BBK82_15300 [Lentzea guizhouensis]|uniref:DUF6801 domain-containing protein n=1 Tax=Lentzea guizhouensis TaxID=1586287 RepID=A0A1B2HHM5_9PSEU|nr:DUF6801 domain-containing protein [Lentzea guizhouensis]ANZ37228.1 hypothetical protein BBK82_15300 [Lentzea guizhouensis]